MTSTPRSGNLSAIADWLQALAVGLRPATSSMDDTQRSVLAAFSADHDLTVEQRAALVELYAAFREINRAGRQAATSGKPRHRTEGRGSI